ncbi:hypothetical protein LCGC14_2541900 [marine sediment metagenome]|uniref:Uncharacterized protein n=1 Tax=marine sediment metagenome TaxID=412755 RepID=A0A0F9AQI2_9ZZZZ
MTKQTKPRYRLERRGETSYVGLWEGRHCLCAICTKTPRGVLDAQLILLVMNSHKDLLAACEALQKRACENCPHPTEPDCAACYFCKQIIQAEAAINNAKAGKEASGE